MSAGRAIFQDEEGRGWLVEVLYGDPAPAERGVFAARFRCPEAPDEPVRAGHVTIDAVERGDEEALREALAAAGPPERSAPRPPPPRDRPPGTVPIV